jgi:hypothetical protein
LRREYIEANGGPKKKKTGGRKVAAKKAPAKRAPLPKGTFKKAGPKKNVGKAKPRVK